MLLAFLAVRVNSLYLQATTAEELSVHKGESVEVLDDCRKWWRVRNQKGMIGFVPGNIMEAKKGSECQEIS